MTNHINDKSLFDGYIKCKYSESNKTFSGLKLRCIVAILELAAAPMPTLAFLCAMLKTFLLFLNTFQAVSRLALACES
jgi:hypothetical protein